MFYPMLDPWKFKLALASEVGKDKYKMLDDGTTFCNFFTREVCHWFGWGEFEHENDDQAGEMVGWMEAHPQIWPVIDGPGRFHLANQRANQGQLVIAGIAEKSEHATGHVCIIAPERMKVSAKWNEVVPCVANVGKRNFYGEHLGMAFKDTPKLFVLKGIP